MKTRMWLVVMSALVALGSETPAAAFGGVREFSVYPSLQYFTWEEFFGGRRILQERGLLYGAGAAVTLDLLQTEAGILTLRGKGDLFGGVVDYDGQTQTALPAKTEVSYFGTRAEGGVGWAFLLARSRIEPFVGLGYRWWLRDIHDTTTTDPSQPGMIQAQGYTEHWESAYAKLGLAFSHLLSQEWRLLAEAGGKYPFYNANTFDLGLGPVTLKPEPRWSAFAELGARYRQLRLILFYEGYRVDQSPVHRVGTTEFLQPQSNEDIVGISVAWCFR
jgi:hypothetical protein